ncbi:MAG TPA: hypothetical protein VHK69_20185, partial [Chitinophagaceae bacterium]|nr:hypothetical protein [Chitinophagaceae bacterium]
EEEFLIARHLISGAVVFLHKRTKELLVLPGGVEGTRTEAQEQQYGALAGDPAYLKLEAEAELFVGLYETFFTGNAIAPETDAVLQQALMRYTGGESYNVFLKALWETDHIDHWKDHELRSFHEYVRGCLRPYDMSYLVMQ